MKRLKIWPDSSLASYFMLVCFVLIAVVWFVQFNRYQTLYFQEQAQLFRFNSFYFNTYLIKPGGITGYLSAFLTQYNFYPWIGATILSLLLAGVYLLFDSVCRRSGKIEYLFTLLFIPVFLWMMALVTQLFSLSYLLGFMIGLAAFRVYIACKKTIRYLSGFILLGIVYILAA